MATAQQHAPRFRKAMPFASPLKWATTKYTKSSFKLPGTLGYGIGFCCKWASFVLIHNPYSRSGTINAINGVRVAPSKLTKSAKKGTIWSMNQEAPTIRTIWANIRARGLKFEPFQTHVKRQTRNSWDRQCTIRYNTVIATELPCSTRKARCLHLQWSCFFQILLAGPWKALRSWSPPREAMRCTGANRTRSNATVPFPKMSQSAPKGRRRPYNMTKVEIRFKMFKQKRL